MRTDILERKEEILQWIHEGQSKAFICKQLQCKQETLNSYLVKMNITYEGKQNWRKNKVANNYIPVEEYIKQSNVKSHILKQKLIREGYKLDQCEICGCREWQGYLLPLELHHKNGNHFDNTLENLAILCPNCHSIQEGNSGANIGKYQQQFNTSASNRNDKKKCIDCGKPISQASTRCENCYHKSTKGKFKVELTDMPITREELKNLIRTKPFVQIGKQFNVTDNAIRKWCDKFNLPRKASEIKQYSDAEWEAL